MYVYTFYISASSLYPHCSSVSSYFFLQVYAMGLADLGGSIPGFIKKIVALKQPVMVKTVEKYYSTLCAKVKAWRQQQSKAGSKKCEESEEVRTLHKIHTVAAWFETQPVSLSTERE